MNTYTQRYCAARFTAVRLSSAIAAYYARLATADDATRRTLCSVWKPELDNASRGDTEAIRRLLETWGTK